MWGKIIIPMYRLWLNGLYELYGPRCPLFSKRPINLISLSLSPGIVINHVDRSFHVLIVTTGDISMIPSFEIWSSMLLELLHCYPVGMYAESYHRNKLWMELKPHWFKNALARDGFPGTSLNSWWRHQTETFSALLSLCDMFALAFSVL